MGVCQSKQKQKNLYLVPDPNFKMVVSQFDRIEFELLKIIFKDLALRSISNKITKQCFSDFFNMIGLWGESVFENFNKEHHDSLNFEEFMIGISLYTKCQQQQKIQHLYDIYNRNGQGGIHREDFLLMLLNYPREQLMQLFDDQAFLEDQKILKMHEQRQQEKEKEKEGNQKVQVVRKSSFFDPMTQNQNQIPPSQIKDSNYQQNDSIMNSIQIMFPSLNRIDTNGVPICQGCTLTLNIDGKVVVLQQVNINQMAKKYVSMIFDSHTKDDNETKTQTLLSFQDFTTLVNQHPLLLNALYKGFNYQLWGIITQNNLVVPALCFSGKDYSGILKKSKRTSKNLNAPFYLQDRYCELQNHFLIVRKKQELNIPNIKRLYVQMVYVLRKQLKGIDLDLLYSIKIRYTSNRPTIAQLGQNKLIGFNYYQSLETSIEDRYRIETKLGDGRFSVVYRGVSKENEESVAIKVIEKFRLTMEEKNILSHETEIMKLLNHSCIVGLIETLETKTHIHQLFIYQQFNNKRYIVTELITHGELFTLVKKCKQISECHAQLIIAQIVDSVGYLHSIGIVHRDLKPENIMVILDEKENIKQIKLIDFGFANYLTNLQGHQTSIVGTYNYIAPEMFRGDPLNFKIDNFAIGVIMYFVLSGTLPFNSDFPDEIINNILEGNFQIEEGIWETISDDAKNLISSLLQRDPKDRIKLSEAMNHPWLKVYNHHQQYKKNRKSIKKQQKRDQEAQLQII